GSPESGPLFPWFDRSRPKGFPVRFLDISAAFETRVRFQGIRLGNPHARLARDGVLSSRNRDERTTSHRRRFSERHIRQFAWASRERKVFAQRKVRITIPHQNSPQIRMAAEANAHHVID